MARWARFYLAFFQILVKRNLKKIFLGVFSFILFLFFGKSLLPIVLPKLIDAYQELRKPTFIEGVVGTSVYPNPLFDSTETQKDISSLIFRGLTKIDSKGTLQPDLADEFKKISDREYFFRLKKDIYWHDGKKFTSDDVVYTVKTAQNPLYQSPLSASFKNVVIEKINNYEVKFLLEEPFTPFPFATTAGIIPKHIPLERYKPIGTGPFVVKKITKDRIVLTNPYLRIIFRFYPNLEEAKLALKLGQIHALGGLSPQEAGSFNLFGNSTTYQANLPYRQAVVFFNTREDLLHDRRVRQALSYCVDKKKLKELVAGSKAVVATNNLALINWVNQTKERYPRNLEEAQRLLRQAGFSQKEGFWEKKGKRLALTVISLDDPEINSIVNFLKESWGRLKVRVDTKLVSPQDLSKNVLQHRNFQVLVNFQELAPDPDQYVLWHTTQVGANNITGISSPKLDKLLEDGRKIDDQKSRAEKYALFSTLLSDEAPAIFLYYPQYNWVVSKKVTGIDFSRFAFPRNRFDSFQNWKIDRKFF